MELVGPPQEWELPMREAINASGFPLQLALENAVRRARPNVEVVGREFPWEDGRGNGGFIDLVLKKDVFYYIIECKRALARWRFLVEDPPPEIVDDWWSVPVGERFRCRWARSEPRYAYQFGYRDFRVEPFSYESEFCVTKLPSKDGQDLFDKTTRELVAATEAFGRDIEARSPGKYMRRVYLPIVVTTAQLEIALVNTTMISLADGQVGRWPSATLQPWLRYRKSLSTSATDFRAEDVQGLKRESERSVFIVRADQFLPFLGQISFKERTFPGVETVEGAQ